MNVSPCVYSKSNSLQRRDSHYFYNTYAHLIQWRPDGKDTALDIGSGPGDVTIDCLLPILPKDFKLLMGTDIVQNMVNYANKVYSNTKISFVQWDMAGDTDDFLEKPPEGFDHVFSTFCLHWETNQQRIFQNIHKLLNNNGDCLLAIVARHSVYDLYLELSKIPKWRPYVRSMAQVSAAYQYEENPVEACRQYLDCAGFKKHQVEIVQRKFNNDNLIEIRKFIEALSPFVNGMCQAEKDDLFVDSVDTMLDLGIGKKTPDGKDVRFSGVYDLLIVYAQK